MGWRRIAAAVTRPVDLGGPLGVTRSGVAYVVDQLRAKGLIARHTGEVPGDRRAVVLTMTDPGRAEAAEVCASIAATRWQLGSVFAAVRDRKDRQQDPQASRRHDRRPVSAITALAQEQASSADPGPSSSSTSPNRWPCRRGRSCWWTPWRPTAEATTKHPPGSTTTSMPEFLAITFDGLRPRHDSRAGDRSVGAVQADGG